MPTFHSQVRPMTYTMYYLRKSRLSSRFQVCGAVFHSQRRQICYQTRPAKISILRVGAPSMLRFVGHHIDVRWSYSDPCIQLSNASRICGDLHRILQCHVSWKETCWISLDWHVSSPYWSNSGWLVRILGQVCVVRWAHCWWSLKMCHFDFDL